MNKLKEPRKEILRPYTKLWNTPFKIYSIDNMKLFHPINPWDALYIMIGIIIMVLFDKLYPGEIPFIIKYIVLPYLFMKFLTNIKLDGKKPHKYFWDLFVFQFFSYKQYERFRPVKKQQLKGFVGEKIVYRYKKRRAKI
jgi:hypothetical protein